MLESGRYQRSYSLLLLLMYNLKMPIGHANTITIVDICQLSSSLSWRESELQGSFFKEHFAAPVRLVNSKTKLSATCVQALNCVTQGSLIDTG